MNKKSPMIRGSVRGRFTKTAFCFAGALGVFGGGVQAGEADGKEPYSPPMRSPSVPNLYWGDTHLHTSASADAYSMGASLSRDEAFRFARGLPVTSNTGKPVRLSRPLDFLAVTDHAEYLGVHARLAEGDEKLFDGWKLGERWARLINEKDRLALGKEFAAALESKDPRDRTPEPLVRSIWEEVSEAADRHNIPGTFTAFTGYEWSSQPSGNNLHRVVLFRDGKEKTAQVLPFSAQDSEDPEDLWSALENYEELTGGNVLAIPHNGNISNGLMFAPTTLSGEPFTERYADRRARWEPVYEVTQVKGDSETHPLLSPDDEFADFETWDDGNNVLSQRKKPEMIPHEYARMALREGLRHEANLGVNPFKFGMIGSTDSHTGLSTTEDDNFFGKFADSEPSPNRITSRMAGFLQEEWQLGAGGIAAVWAEENTREALFDAFMRREVYGTTGSRMKVRFFGGWDYEERDIQRPDYARIGYRKGVPMGGDLTAVKGREAPIFMVAAARDPQGANLDRVQIVKGWLDEDGKTHERVFNVAVSDDRKEDPDTGRVPPVGNTVDLQQATYLNSIGDSELAAVWVDPDFDPEQKAFYYVRVLEIPTPRWTVYDAYYFGKKLPWRVRKIVQERAYTSPIWYTP